MWLPSLRSLAASVASTSLRELPPSAELSPKGLETLRCFAALWGMPGALLSGGSILWVISNICTTLEYFLCQAQC